MDRIELKFSYFARDWQIYLHVSSVFGSSKDDKVACRVSCEGGGRDEGGGILHYSSLSDKLVPSASRQLRNSSLSLKLS